MTETRRVMTWTSPCLANGCWPPKDNYGTAWVSGTVRWHGCSTFCGLTSLITLYATYKCTFPLPSSRFVIISYKCLQTPLPLINPKNSRRNGKPLTGLRNPKTAKRRKAKKCVFPHNISLWRILRSPSITGGCCLRDVEGNYIPWLARHRGRLSSDRFFSYDP